MNDRPGIRLLGAVRWRRNPSDNFEDGNAVRWRRDADGNGLVEGRDDRNEPFLVPNTPDYIKERNE